MAEDEAYQRLIERGLRYVSYRPRSQTEFRQFIHTICQRKNIPAETEQAVLSRMQELGYLDDRAFAVWWVEQRDAHRPKSQRILRMELHRKGIDKELIDSVLQELQAEDSIHSEADRARSAVRKKVAGWEQLALPERKKKLYDFLGRRGFSHDVCQRLVDELWRKD